jgi:mono/diheme cytochrome c family protein
MRPIRSATLVPLLAVAVLAGSVAPGRGQPGTDTRQRLVLPAAARDKVLAEMRTMLESINGILRAVDAKDTAAIEAAARPSGLAMAAEMDPSIVQQLPVAFRELGMRTHRGFDELVERMRAGGTPDDAVRALATITGNCVACHAVYRLDEAR